MYENQTLKSFWINFLSVTYFKSKEFKYIKMKFISAHPQFRATWLYQKVYRAFREVQSTGLMLVDTSTHTYKYTSASILHGLKDELDRVSSSEVVKKQLYIDYERLKTEAGQLNCEIEILSRYIDLYPTINEKIVGFISDNNVSLKIIQSEIIILDKLINTI